MSKIILLRGMSGTGKSTLSNELGKRISVPVLHKDDIYDSVAEYVVEHGQRNQICFDFLYRFLQTVIDSSATIILDYGLNQIDDVLRLKNWIEAKGATFITIYCTCSDESIWSERLASRSLNPLPNQLITSLSGLKEHYRNVKMEHVAGELILDTVKDPKILIDQVEAYLSERRFSSMKLSSKHL